MKTKNKLLAEANKLFPKFYESRRPQNPEFLFKPGQKLPEVVSIVIFYAEHEEEGRDAIDAINEGAGQPMKDESGRDEFPFFTNSKAEGKITLLTTRHNRSFLVRFACFSDEDDATCLIIGKYSRNIAHFAKEFLQFFFFEFLSEREIIIDEWNNWDMTRPRE